MGSLGPKTTLLVAISVVATAASGVATFAGASAVLAFIVSAVALASLASVVGDGTEQLGSRLGPGATGLLQSALGNLPELFIGIFALRAGLVAVVQAALVGSILGNSLLVLGIAFTLGGLANGTQKFQTGTPRLIALMTVLSVGAVTIPTMASKLQTPAAHHEEQLSVTVAIMLLALFVASLFFVLRGGEMAVTLPPEEGRRVWPIGLALAVVGGASLAAAFTSDWFVQALTPATQSLHISQGFTGLVIVALAGNAVENVVGVQFAVRNQADLAVSVILNSSLQIALALVPALIILSLFISGANLTLVLAPLLIVALALAAIVGAIVTYDGESTWIEGLGLIGLYAIVAAAFWWG